MKILKNYVDVMLGFQISFDEILLVEMYGESVPLIDYEALQLRALEWLANKPGRLVGSEIRFVRTYFDMTLSRFGQQFGVTHSAVKKWEDDSAVMNWGAEALLRLLAYRAAGKHNIDGLLDSLATPRTGSDTQMHVLNAEVNRNVTRLLDPEQDRAAIAFVEKRLALQWGTIAVGTRIHEDGFFSAAKPVTADAFKEYLPDGVEHALADAA